MSLLGILVRIAFAAVILAFTYGVRGKKLLLPGRVGAVVRAFAYVATYVSAVALVGFAGVGHFMGMLFSACGLGAGMLIARLKTRGTALPDWLAASHTPWPDMVLPVLLMPGQFYLAIKTGRVYAD